MDAVIRMFDELRIEAGKSKAQLAREIDKNPASIRRLFTSEANPELKRLRRLRVLWGLRSTSRSDPLDRRARVRLDWLRSRPTRAREVAL